MSRKFYETNFEKQYATGNYWGIFDNDFALHFEPNEDDKLVPSYVKSNRKDFKDGIAVTITTTSNGYVLKCGKVTTIHDSVYNMQGTLIKATMIGVPLRKEFAEVEEHFEVYDDFEQLCSDMHSFYQTTK